MQNDQLHDAPIICFPTWYIESWPKRENAEPVTCVIRKESQIHTCLVNPALFRCDAGVLWPEEGGTIVRDSQDLTQA